jgi:CubicO group peptidase (beta-lactamase class C family)
MSKRSGCVVGTLVTMLAAILALAAGVSPPTAATAGAVSGQGTAAACQNPAPVIAEVGGAVTQPVVTALQGLAGALAAPAAQLPSLAVAVVLDQQVIFAAGFGCADIAMGTPATPQTVYKIESITKVFEATMAMQQRDAGRYQLTDTVDRYVPQVYYRLMDGQRFSPTFLELASHTAGLPDPIPNGVMTLPQFWQYLEGVTTITTPGTYSYSDLGFVTLGQSVSIIAGQEYHDYVAANIFQPLGMTSSTYDYTPLLGTAALAIPYAKAAGGWRSAAPNAYQTSFETAGNVFTTVEDMAQMVMLQFRTGPAGGSQILACSSIQEMWQPVAPTQGSGYSTIGWFTNPYGPSYTVISKNGGDPWWSTLVRFIPEVRLGVIAFTNAGKVGSTLGSVEQQILQALVPLLPTNPPSC